MLPRTLVQDAFSWQGDRVLSNFGTVVSEEELFNPTPAWAAFTGNEMHRGVSVVEETEG
jgi:hypothetical protein